MNSIYTKSSVIISAFESSANIMKIHNDGFCLQLLVKIFEFVAIIACIKVILNLRCFWNIRLLWNPILYNNEIVWAVNKSRHRCTYFYKLIWKHMDQICYFYYSDKVILNYQLIETKHGRERYIFLIELVHKIYRDICKSVWDCDMHFWRVSTIISQEVKYNLLIRQIYTLQNDKKPIDLRANFTWSKLFDKGDFTRDL